MGSVPLLLTACGGPRPSERLAYQDVQQCIQDGKVSTDVCEREYQLALEARARSSHFGNLDDCQAQYGDQCRPYVSDSGAHWFVPALTGFMIGRLMGHGHGYFYGPGGFSGPMYRERPGRAEWGGYQSGTAGAPHVPGTAQTLSRGGFGYSGAARASWGG